MATHQARLAGDLISQDFGSEVSSADLAGVDSASPPRWSNAMGFAVCPLSTESGAPSVARHFTRSTLRGWGMHACVDDAVTSISELVTNAMRHGSRSWQGVRSTAGLQPLIAVSSRASLAAQPVLLSLARRGEHLFCSVLDPSDGAPILRSPGHFAESGRGLHVVASLSRAWGWTVPDHFGKVVWAIFSNSPDADFEAGSVPTPGSVASVTSVTSRSASGSRSSRSASRSASSGAISSVDASTPQGLDPLRVPVPGCEQPAEDWDPLTRVLLLMEILSEPPWLEELGAVVRAGRSGGRV